MRPFRYARPTTVDELLGLLKAHGRAARLLAGGTDLLVRLRLGHVTADIVIDIKRVADLRADLRPVPDAATHGNAGALLRIGALALMRDVVDDRRVRQHFPALVEAAWVVGSVQIRNRATLAGNICNASPAADTAPALLVYRAIVNIVGVDGARRVPIDEFFTGPGRTVLTTEEIVESIDLPLPDSMTGTDSMTGPHSVTGPDSVTGTDLVTGSATSRATGLGTGAAFGRVTRRYGVDLASLNLCCLVTPQGETRFAYGAVGPRPFLVQDDSGALADRRTPAAVKEDILHRLMQAANPISDIRADRDYRIAMLAVMSRRALATALERREQAAGQGDDGQDSRGQRSGGKVEGGKADGGKAVDGQAEEGAPRA